MTDGARNALLGYLYQLLGTAAVKVRELPAGADAWAHLIASVGQGDLIVEEFGQDATVHPTATPNRGVTAIQFKHSSNVESQIDRDELIEILVAFDRSRRDAESVDVAIEHYTLVTNRRLDPRAQEIVDQRANPTPHRSLRLTTTRNREPVAGNMRRLEPYQGDPDRAATAWQTIVRSLAVLEGVTFEAGLHRLRGFAASYGVLEREWVHCLDSLIAAFVRQTAEGRTIRVTREWLKEHMIGDQDAANLKFGSSFVPHISAICRDHLEKRIEQQHRIRPEFFLERQVQQQLQTLLDQYPVVFVAGGGGRGKSLAVANYLRSVADRQLVWSEGAATASERVVVGAITAARLPRSPHSGIDRCLGDIRSRLEVANGSRRLLWTIDLDGIDEAPEQFSQLRELINLCWARGTRDASPASIIVTCRSETGSNTREELISKWLDTPEPDLVNGVGFVELDNFIGQELDDVAMLINRTPEKRIAQTASRGVLREPQNLSAVSEEILLSLRHPVVWGEYASLTELERNGVLDKNRVHLDHLAKQLHNRFLRRCQVRTRWRDRRMLERALPQIARAHTGPPPYSPETWDRACRLCLSQIEARDLYSESLSYGIIERDAGRSWRWAHPFLVNYLVTLNGGDTDE